MAAINTESTTGHAEKFAIKGQAIENYSPRGYQVRGDNQVYDLLQSTPIDSEVRLTLPGYDVPQEGYSRVIQVPLSSPAIPPKVKGNLKGKFSPNDVITLAAVHGHHIDQRGPDEGTGGARSNALRAVWITSQEEAERLAQALEEKPENLFALIRESNGGPITDSRGNPAEIRPGRLTILANVDLGGRRDHAVRSKPFPRDFNPNPPPPRAAALPKTRPAATVPHPLTPPLSPPSRPSPQQEEAPIAQYGRAGDNEPIPVTVTPDFNDLLDELLEDEPEIQEAIEEAKKRQRELHPFLAIIPGFDNSFETYARQKIKEAVLGSIRQNLPPGATREQAETALKEALKAYWVSIADKDREIEKMVAEMQTVIEPEIIGQELAPETQKKLDELPVDETGHYQPPPRRTPPAPARRRRPSPTPTRPEEPPAPAEPAPVSAEPAPVSEEANLFQFFFNRSPTPVRSQILKQLAPYLEKHPQYGPQHPLVILANGVRLEDIDETIIQLEAILRDVAPGNIDVNQGLIGQYRHLRNNLLKFEEEHPKIAEALRLAFDKERRRGFTKSRLEKIREKLGLPQLKLRLAEIKQKIKVPERLKKIWQGITSGLGKTLKIIGKGLGTPFKLAGAGLEKLILILNRSGIGRPFAWILTQGRQLFTTGARYVGQAGKFVGEYAGRASRALLRPFKKAYAWVQQSLKAARKAVKEKAAELAGKGAAWLAKKLGIKGSVNLAALALPTGVTQVLAIFGFYDMAVSLVEAIPVIGKPLGLLIDIAAGPIGMLRRGFKIFGGLITFRYFREGQKEGGLKGNLKQIFNILGLAGPLLMAAFFTLGPTALLIGAGLVIGSVVIIGSLSTIAATTAVLATTTTTLVTTGTTAFLAWLWQWQIRLNLRRIIALYLILISLSTFIVVLISGGAFMVTPQETPQGRFEEEIISSAYIDVVKTAVPGEVANPLQTKEPAIINYRIEIYAVENALTNITVSNETVIHNLNPDVQGEYQVVKDASGNQIRLWDSSNSELIPLILNPDEVIVLEYDVALVRSAIESQVGVEITDISQIHDSWLIDTVIATADVIIDPDDPEQNIIGESQSASARVKIGDPSEMIPTGWPTSGFITQGPRAVGGSHDPDGAYSNSIDIAAGEGTPVYATHNGTAYFYRDGGKGGTGGNWIKLCSSLGCDHFETRYVHLQKFATEFSDIDDGGNTSVSFCQLIGFVNSTGNSEGNHLHYELRGNPGLGVDILSYVPATSPPIEEKVYLPPYLDRINVSSSCP